MGTNVNGRFKRKPFNVTVTKKPTLRLVKAEMSDVFCTVCRDKVISVPVELKEGPWVCVECSVKGNS
jgi:formylmethanofuran dehydrogenase subunit E